MKTPMTRPAAVAIWPFSIMPILWVSTFSCLLSAKLELLPGDIILHTWNIVSLGIPGRFRWRICSRNNVPLEHIQNCIKADISEYEAVLGACSMLFTFAGLVHQSQIPTGTIDIAMAVLISAVIVDFSTLVATIICIQLLNTVVEPAQIRGWYAACQSSDTVRYPEMVLSLPVVGLAWSAIGVIVSLLLSLLSVQIPGTTSASLDHFPLDFAIPLAGIACACTAFLTLFLVQFARLLDRSQRSEDTEPPAVNIIEPKVSNKRRE